MSLAETYLSLWAPGLGEDLAISNLQGELGPVISGEDVLVSATLSPAHKTIYFEKLDNFHLN